MRLTPEEITLNLHISSLFHDMNRKIRVLFSTVLLVALFAAGIILLTSVICNPGKPLVAGAAQSKIFRHRPASSRDGKPKYPETKGWKTFRSEDYGFQLSYPPGGQLQTDSTMNQVRVKIDLPVPGGTLLKEKFLLIKAEKPFDHCPSSLPGEGVKEVIIINQHKWVKTEGTEGAAGHIYEHLIYSTVKDRRCYVLDGVLSSVNPGVYTSPPPDFDRGESAVFSRIAYTFEFI